MTEIVLNQVRKSFGSTEILHGIDLRIGSGEFVVFVGPSGCGKSTLLRCVAGLEQVTAGEIKIDGETVNHIAPAERGLAMVFQSYALYPHMTVYKNMAFGLENTKLPREQISARVKEAAAMLQLTPYLERKPKALSGGQRQRVAIGRAIVREPKAFLFDEPLSNLDAELRVTMRKELAALHNKIGGTMIFVTHDQTEAMTLADKIVVLQNGNVEQHGKPLELYNKPCNAFVAGFIGSPSMNLIKATVNNGFFAADGIKIAIPESIRFTESQNVTLGIRPEHLRIVEDAAAADFSAKVEVSEQLGGETYVYCSAEKVQLTIHQPGQLPITSGDMLHLIAQRENLHIFDAAGKTIVNGIR